MNSGRWLIDWFSFLTFCFRFSQMWSKNSSRALSQSKKTWCPWSSFGDRGWSISIPRMWDTFFIFLHPWSSTMKKDGKMERWKDGKMERWKEMERWKLIALMTTDQTMEGGVFLQRYCEHQQWTCCHSVVDDVASRVHSRTPVIVWDRSLESQEHERFLLHILSRSLLSCLCWMWLTNWSYSRIETRGYHWNQVEIVGETNSAE